MNSKNLINTIKKEPYVKLLDGNELSNWNKEDEVIYNQQIRQKAKAEFYQNAFEFLSAHSVGGDYYEFGCHKARTFRMVLTEARKKNFQNMNFYAFDSFDGLPDLGTKIDEHNSIYSAGALTTSEDSFLEIIETHNIYQNKVKTIKGFYEDSLTISLKENLVNKKSKIALVTLDCSFYDSFVCSFDFIEDLIQEGSIIYIDDYRSSYKGNPTKGAAKAFKEFTKKSKFKFDEFLNIGWFGKSYLVYKEDT